MGTFRAAPEYAEALARTGLTDYETTMSHTGGRLVSVHEGRSVVRVAGRLYLKRFVEKSREALREIRALAHLGDGPGPEPVPLAASGEGERGAFLVTAAPDDAVPLSDALHEWRGDARDTMVRAVGKRIRALHERGLGCPDLMARHLLVAPPDRVWLFDAGRLTRRGGIRRRARDLAALELSLPYGAVGARDRVRFLSAYLGRKPRSGEFLLRLVETSYRRLDRRSRHRRERFVAAPDEREFLSRQGIETFDDLMTYRGPGARRLRRLRDRENWRIDLGGRTFFVKRHRPVKGLSRTPASREWEAVALFRRAGIRTMRPVAFGEDVARGSTIWVERAEGAPLDDLLRDGDLDARTRREIVTEAATVLRTMRCREMHHRDMYCCHLITDPDAPPGKRLTVIDLQRARRMPGLRRRWYVKDIAQLYHSAPRPPVTGSELARFLRVYAGVEKLGPAEKTFARRVERKAARIG